LDISDPRRGQAFERWQQNDGTKVGLLILINSNNEKVTKP
jgi:hypothetical protein